MGAAGLAFMEGWAIVERAYRRPLSWLTRCLRYAFYPLLALVMVGWLAWDWQHARKLDAAEDVIFDLIVRLRPHEPALSGKTLVVEIDDCSIDYYRARGEGGWPWPRERHADLIEALDRAGVGAVGLDILFADHSSDDPEGDALLDAIAAAGEGRFLFAASRMHPDFDASASLHAHEVPGAFELTPGAIAPGPSVAVMQPFGMAMARHSGLVNIRRASDGLLRDMRLYEAAGDWALPSLPLRLAQISGADTRAAIDARDGDLRINWRNRTRLSYASAADILEGHPVCSQALPPLANTVALVGHTAAGINDIKPTPVDLAMPGVETLAEAVEALLADSWVRMPPVWLKYTLATGMVLLSTFVFWRGEPHRDVDPAFFGLNLALVTSAFAGLVLFGWFIDIFASVAYGALCFGLCRRYASVQRKRANGNTDYLAEFDAKAKPWLLMVRLRFAPNPTLPKQAVKRKRREYRRLLHRHVHADGGIVMVDGLVERKHWLNPILDDLVLLLWHGDSADNVHQQARYGLDALHASLTRSGEHMQDGIHIMACASMARIDPRADSGEQRQQLRELLWQDLGHLQEWPLGQRDATPLIASTQEEYTACASLPES